MSFADVHIASRDLSVQYGIMEQSRSEDREMPSEHPELNITGIYMGDRCITKELNRLSDYLFKNKNINLYEDIHLQIEKHEERKLS